MSERLMQFIRQLEVEQSELRVELSAVKDKVEELTLALGEVNDALAGLEKING